MIFSDKSGLFINAWRICAAGLTEPKSEFQFAIEAGRKFRFDWAFPAVRIGIEIDGGQWVYGGGRHARDGDKIKGNLAAELGWRVFHFSPDMLNRDPLTCIEQVVRALEHQR